MIQVTHGNNNLKLHEIADHHWKIINPKTKRGDYKINESLIGRMNRLMERHHLRGEYSKENFYRILLDNNAEYLKTIITCSVNDLPIIIDEVKALLDYCNLLNRLNEIDIDFSVELLEEAFQYQNWRSNGKADKLFDLLDIEVCPYCNLTHTFWDDEAKKLIVSYDHYYDKSSYPFLSLTFSNLIPSCSICNTSYKSTWKFSIETHLHPYLDDYNSCCSFSSNYVGDPENHKIVINVLKGDDHRTPRYNSEFSLEGRYNINGIRKNVVGLFELVKDYDDTKKEELLKREFFNTIEEVEEMICKRFGIPYAIESILNTQYGKLKRDIAIQFGLITN